MAKYVNLDIPGGPVRVRATGITLESRMELGWWRVGQRKLQIARHYSAENWSLTGNGIDVLPSLMSEFGPPPLVGKAVRAWMRDHRAWLEQCQQERHPDRPISGYSFDGERMGVTFGWDDTSTYGWHGDAIESGTVLGELARRWIRSQARQCGMRVTFK